MESQHFLQDRDTRGQIGKLGWKVGWAAGRYLSDPDTGYPGRCQDANPGYLAQVSSGYGHLKQLGNIMATCFLC